MRMPVTRALTVWCYWYGAGWVGGWGEGGWTSQWWGGGVWLNEEGKRGRGAVWRGRGVTRLAGGQHLKHSNLKLKNLGSPSLVAY